MSGAYGNVRGFLYKDPEMRRSKSGSDYATATLKVRDGDDNKFWRVMAFKESAAALMRFKDRDGLKAEGGIKVDTYERDGQTKIGLTIMANNIEAFSPQAKGNDDRQPHR
jgi:Single-strand binding protein family